MSLVGSAAPPGRMFLSSLPIRWARSASPRFPPAIVRCASGAGDPRSVGVTTSGAGDPRSVGSHDHPRLLRRDHRSGWVSRSPVCYNLVQLPARECPFNTLYGAVWADTYFREAVLTICRRSAAPCSSGLANPGLTAPGLRSTAAPRLVLTVTSNQGCRAMFCCRFAVLGNRPIRLGPRGLKSFDKRGAPSYCSSTFDQFE